jgi:hypothetical protein
MQDDLQLLDADMLCCTAQTALDKQKDDGLVLPTTFTSNVWERLPPSSRELMHEALSLVDYEPEQKKSCMHSGDGAEGKAATAASHGAPRPQATGQGKLDVVSAAQIFLAKRAAPKDRGLSVRLAAKYKVTAKTVRDIWKRRTWTIITDHF